MVPNDTLGPFHLRLLTPGPCFSSFSLSPQISASNKPHYYIHILNSEKVKTLPNGCQGRNSNTWISEEFTHLSDILKRGHFLSLPQAKVLKPPGPPFTHF